MKKSDRSVLMALAVLATQALATAAYADQITVGEPAYNGTGCPVGSAAVALSPDQSSLSILFDQYVVESGGTTGKRVDRRNCNIGIPVHVPQGMSVSIFQVDYRGFNSIPSGGSAQFNVEYFFQTPGGGAARGVRDGQRFRGPLNEDFIFSNTLQASAIVWSPCGQDVILRTNSNMMNTTNNRYEQTLSSVDSVDLSAAIVYHFQWKRCGSFGGGGYPY